MIKNKAILTSTSYLSMYFLGVSGTIIGAAAKNIGLTPYQIGIIIAIQNVGFIISVIISGSLADTINKPKLLSIGSFILGTSFLVFYRVPAFLINTIIMFFIGFGIGIFEGTTDPMLLELHNRNKSLYINVNHFFVNIGSLTITIYLMFLNMNWRKSTIQSGFIVISLAILFLFLKVENPNLSNHSIFKRIKLISNDIKRLIVIFILTMFAVGLETGTIGILTSYLMDIRGFSQLTSKLGLIIFISGIASGRLLTGYLTSRFKLLSILMIFFIFGSFAYVLLFFLNSGDFIYFIIYLTGFSVSALLPILISITGSLYSDMSGTALGFIKMGIPIGGIIVPLIISLVTKYYHFMHSLVVFPLLGIIGFILIALNYTNLMKESRI